jgi:hypothetical protein
MFTNYSLIEVGELVQAKAAHPQVPFMVVANPDGGPGTAYNVTYADGLEELQAAGITVLGYVPTDWGQTPIPSVESEIGAFYGWYHPDGIYLDQMYNEEYSWNGNFIPTYYSTLTAYIKSLGMGEVFGNSGADIPYYFIGSVSTIGYFENSYEPSLSLLGGWHTEYAKSNFAFFAYNVTSVDPYYVAAASDYASYLYLTSGQKPFPYNSLPAYFGELVSDLGSLVPVTVQTQAPNGSLVSRGFEVTVTQPDGISSTGYTPATFDVVSGSTVTVSAVNNRGYVLDHWSDGSKSAEVTVKPTAATTLIAYSKTQVSNATIVSVQTTEPDGTPVVGIWTTVSDGTAIVASGYTPFMFVATRGVNYTIAVQNFSTYTFDTWSNGEKDQVISLTPSSDEALFAYFFNGTTGSGINSTTTASTSAAGSTTAAPGSATALVDPLLTMVSPRSDSPPGLQTGIIRSGEDAARRA